MEQERSRNVAVGLTTIGGLVGLLALLFLFGYVPTLMQTGYLVSIKYPHASGLHPGSRVHLNGIDIGKVESIQLDAPVGAGVTVVARIQDDIRLPSDMIATVNTPLLGGSSTVEMLVEDESMFANGTLPLDGTAVIEGQVGSIASQFSREMTSALEGPTQQFTKLSESFNELSAEWRDVAVNLKALTEQRDIDAVDEGLTTGNLATVLARADKRLAEMEATLENLNKWAGDEKLRKDFQDTMAGASKATTQLNTSIPRVEKRLIALADDMAKTTASVNALLEEAKSGEGTVGKLINDPALYDNLNDSAQRLQTVLDEAKLLLEKWKAEGVPVQF